MSTGTLEYLKVLQNTLIYFSDSKILQCKLPTDSIRPLHGKNSIAVRPIPVYRVPTHAV